MSTNAFENLVWENKWNIKKGLEQMIRAREQASLHWCSPLLSARFMCPRAHKKQVNFAVDEIDFEWNKIHPR